MSAKAVRKTLSFVLALTLVVSLFPACLAYADSEEAEVAEVSVSYEEAVVPEDSDSLQAEANDDPVDDAEDAAIEGGEEEASIPEGEEAAAESSEAEPEGENGLNAVAAVGNEPDIAGIAPVSDNAPVAVIRPDQLPKDVFDDPDRKTLEEENPFNDDNVDKGLKLIGGALPFGTLIYDWLKMHSDRPPETSEVVEDVGTTIVTQMVDSLVPGAGSLVSVVKDIIKKLF